MARFINSQLILFVIVTNFCLIAAIKYTLLKVGDVTIHKNQGKVTSEENVKRLTIQDEFEVFDRNLLDIREKTPIFIMDQNYQMRRIQSGAFVDQDITETILIANTELKVIEKGTFKNLPIFELVLKENEITHLEKEAIVNLPNLETINLSNNKIVGIYENSIINAPAVYLDMAYNRLKEIKANWFNFMNDENPVTVLLDNNEIRKLDCMAFNTVKLETLNLRNNEIKQLPSEIFEEDTIIRVYLQENRLERLPESFFRLSHLVLVTLNGNPLDCDTQRKLRRLQEHTSAKITYQHNCNTRCC